MMTLIFVVSATGVEFLVVLRLATVVFGATTLILLCASAIEQKNVILYEDLTLTRGLQQSAEELFQAILPRSGRKGLAALVCNARDESGALKDSLPTNGYHIHIEECHHDCD